MLYDDRENKKDFMVRWRDTKGVIHNTKVLHRFVSAIDALNYIKRERKTYKNGGEAWLI